MAAEYLEEMVSVQIFGEPTAEVLATMRHLAGQGVPVSIHRPFAGFDRQPPQTGSRRARHPSPVRLGWELTPQRTSSSTLVPLPSRESQRQDSCRRTRPSSSTSIRSMLSPLAVSPVSLRCV